MNPALMIGLVFSVVFPIGLLIWWKKKTGSGLWPFLAGALCFFLFANTLEALLHQLVLGGSLSAVVYGSPVLYMLYGSFAAGIFEETGRLFGFRVLLKNRREKRCAVAYGIGHGGIEVFLTVGVAYLLYILTLCGLSLGDAATDAAMLEAAGSISVGTALLAMAERVSAVLVHTGLSMLMFTAVKAEGKKWLYPVSICLHALADMPACLYQMQVIRSLAVIEILAFVMGLAYLLIGRRVLAGYAEPAPETAPAAEESAGETAERKERAAEEEI